MGAEGQPRPATVDVAGLRLDIEAVRPSDLALIERIIGTTPTALPRHAVVTIDDVGPAVPDRTPDFEGLYGHHWDDGSIHAFRHAYGLTAVVADGSVHLGGPVAGHRRWITVRNSMLFVLARLMYTQGRFMLHGGAVRRDDRATLLVGPSGTGKSSLAFAASRAGWTVLGDDMVVVEPTADGPLVRGIPRVPSLPADVADAAGIQGEDLPSDPRLRRELVTFAVDTRAALVDGLVVCGHDDGAGRLAALSVGEALGELVSAFVLSALADPVTAWFPVAASIARGPSCRLLHAAEPSERLDRAAVLLDATRAADGLGAERV